VAPDASREPVSYGDVKCHAQMPNVDVGTPSCRNEYQEMSTGLGLSPIRSGARNT
jgi:hypothetical protein